MSEGSMPSVRSVTVERLEILEDEGRVSIIQGAGTISALRRYFAEEAQARAVAEEPEWEYGHDCDESRATHGSNPSPQNEWPAMGTCTNATSYRRRKAGPWVPVEQAGAET